MAGLGVQFECAAQPGGTPLHIHQPIALVGPGKLEPPAVVADVQLQASLTYMHFDAGLCTRGMAGGIVDRLFEDQIQLAPEIGVGTPLLLALVSLEPKVDASGTRAKCQHWGAVNTYSGLTHIPVYTC